MNSWRTFLTGTALTLGVGGGLVACGDDGPKTLALDEYAESFCDAADNLKEVFDSEFSQDINDALEQEELTDDEANELLENLDKALGQADDAITTMSGELRGIVPDDPDGEEFQKQTIDYFDEFSDAIAQIQSELRDVDPEDLTDGPDELNTLLDEATPEMDNPSRDNDDFEAIVGALDDKCPDR